MSFFRYPGTALLLTAVISACGGEPVEPSPTPEPVDVTVVVSIGGLSTDDDGFDLLISNTVVARLGGDGRTVDSVTVEVIPGDHNLRFSDLDEACFTSDLNEQQSFFLPGNRVEAEVFCRPQGSVQIAYTVEGEFDSEIQILSEAGFEPWRPGGASEWHPSWSSDGSRLAHVSDRDGNPEIYLSDFDGEDDLRLTQHDGQDLDPAWSPDGSMVAFVSDRGGTGLDLLVSRVADREVTRLTDSSRPEADPAWSPDGEWIVYSRFDMVIEQLMGGGADTSFVHRTLRISPDGGQPERLFDGEAPAFSPDGSRIFTATELLAIGGNGVISRKLDGSDFQIHTSPGGPNRTDIAVSPDGEFVVYADDKLGGFRIYVTEIATGVVSRVTTGSGTHLAPAWRPGTFVEAGGG